MFERKAALAKLTCPTFQDVLRPRPVLPSTGNVLDMRKRADKQLLLERGVNHDGIGVVISIVKANRAARIRVVK